MAHFYGRLYGRARTSATRCGTKNSGITALLNGWDVGVYVELNHNDETGKDGLTAFRTRGRNGGVERLPLDTIIEGVHNGV